MTDANNYTGLEVAVIGMSVRVPGADDYSGFWENLKAGKESVRFFSTEELLKSGIDPALLNDENYIRAKATLDDIEYFDPAFFHYSPREAVNMDPQLRILNETVWQALEDAGYNPDNYDGSIGLYAGASLNVPWIARFFTDMNDPAELFNLSNLNDNSSFATAVSYKLNLRGPSVNVNTACSTSLVAIHMACKALQSGECEIAMAGGVSISLPSFSGYLYQEGMIYSPDGHCRAFDEAAKGTVNGDGAGIVVLKLLENALADGDCIRAVIRESAINNDGNRKVGYTAPSVKGQYEVIRTAIRAAGIDPSTITYVEAHGTGTSLGDPVEVEALTQAFATNTPNHCALGSVKTNIGHLDTAAGVAGFVKTVLALQHRQIPPSLNFSQPNSKINFAASPFFVNTELRDWHTHGFPLRAGVSSFGIGGTNAHLILEEAPQPVAEKKQNRSPQLVLLSAGSESALHKMTEELQKHLAGHPGICLSDLAFTLDAGRRHHPYRKAFTGQSIEEVAQQLSTGATQPATHFDGETKHLYFMFPGQGAQYPGMGRGLYEQEPYFRQVVDECLALLQQHSPVDFKSFIITGTAGENEISQTSVTQPLLFVVEYAMARLLMHWGYSPKGFIGHSIGEYVAACLAGVFSLNDALLLVTHRGRLMQEAPAGTMLGIQAGAETIRPLLTAGVDLAAINSTGFCSVAGSEAAIQNFSRLLAEQEIPFSHLHTSHAFHSYLMDGVVNDFLAVVRKVKLNPPSIPCISNISGGWLGQEEAVDPEYWSRQIRATVQFAAGTELILSDPRALCLETGPGRSLATFVNRHRSFEKGHQVQTTMRHVKDETNDLVCLLQCLGKLWQTGLHWNPEQFYAGQSVGRIPLPTYAFDRKRYWPTPEADKAEPAGDLARVAQQDMGNWFYAPVWRPAVSPAKEVWPEGGICRLIFSAGLAWEKEWIKELGEGETILVEPGSSFASLGQGRFSINPAKEEDIRDLVNELSAAGKIPRQIIHLWSWLTPPPEQLNTSDLNDCLDKNFYSLLWLARELGNAAIVSAIDLRILSLQAIPALPGEAGHPALAPLTAAAKVIPQEYSNIRCTRIDIDPAALENLASLAGEMSLRYLDPVVAGRNGERLVESAEPLYLPAGADAEAGFETGGVYLVAGGLGGLGLSLAAWLGKAFKARLGLLSSSGFPSRTNWQQWLEQHDPADPVSVKIKTILQIEAGGGQVKIYQADLADEAALQEVWTDMQESQGRINGILHCAGRAEGALIQRRSREMSDRVLDPKIRGTWALHQLMRNDPSVFMVLFSSLGNILYQEKIGQVAYTAANEFFDAFTRYRNHTTGARTLTINWDDWADVGMSAASVLNWDEKLGIVPEGEDNFKVSMSEPGNLASISPITAERKMPGAGELEIRIEVAALNFKDVLYALGLIPLPENQALAFGQECSGTVVRTGPGVKAFKPGDRVVAMPGQSCFSAYTTCLERDVALMPDGMGFEEAATLPVSYMTAYYALHRKAAMAAGESILIHAAAGGVGLAAVHLAKAAGCTIYGTAGSQEKREYLRSAGLTTVMNSRQLSFADELKQATNGEGVDLVLNSLSGPFLFTSFELLKPNGRFLELGIKDIMENAPLPMSVFARGCSFISIQIGPEMPDYETTWREMMHYIREHKIPALPYKVFSLAELNQAFEYMAASRHTGKVLVSMSGADELLQTLYPGRRQSSRPAVPVTENLFRQRLKQSGIATADGIQAMVRAMASGRERILVSPVNLQLLLSDQQHAFQLPGAGATAGNGLPVHPDTYEEKIRSIFAGFFGLPDFDLDDNIFEKGASSLDVIQLNNRINKALGLDTPFVTLYKHQTIRDLLGFLMPGNEPAEAGNAPVDRSQELKKGRETAQQRLQMRKNLRK